ncbi:MAG: hypothetical protein D6679_09685 [Candidatus Hydrogenedentota bacterium]|nr:MAG: hypothetical protein D6679_09685 [Candidatus Hydrogenedentota bacterium]
MILRSEIGYSLLEYSLKEAPREAVALLWGHGETITAVRILTNISKEEGVFELDEEEVEGAVREYQNLTLLGFFHSHPTDIPAPSVQDIDGAEGTRIPFHVILSLKPRPCFRCWRIFGGQVYPERVDWE